MASKSAASAAKPKKTIAKPLSNSAAQALETPVAPASAPLKKGAVGKVAAPKAAKASKESKAITFSTEDISLRAYFIAEHRQRHNLHGDSHSDWLEAKRQLEEEHSRNSKPRAKK